MSDFICRYGYRMLAALMASAWVLLGVSHGALLYTALVAGYSLLVGWQAGREHECEEGKG